MASTLVLYDTTGQWGWLGEIYGIMSANLVSHFGTWTALPVVKYTSGMMNSYTAVVYIGSSYGEPIPSAFLTDVLAGNVPVIWCYDNIWLLTAASPNFQSTYGWNWSGFDYSSVATVNYKGQALKRYASNGAGIMNYSAVASPATTLATAVRSDNTTFPWAVRSRNLTYIGENPLVYISEGDRYLAFCDLLFDALAPTTATSHLAFVRLEDLNPNYDPTSVLQYGQWLQSQGVPFGFQFTPLYLDPNGYYNNGTPQTIHFSQSSTMISAIKQLQSMGGVMIEHGYTHQYSNVDNPYTGVSGDDAEFFRITQNADLTLNYVGPVPGDSQSWAAGRFASAAAEFQAAGFATPTISTLPCYVGSAADYAAAAAAFAVHAERSLYYYGQFSGTIDSTRYAGQYFPFSVKDVYGRKVLADTLGGIQPTAYQGIPPRLAADILADSQRLLCVRAGVGVFFANPEDPITNLQQTVTGMKSQGYTFVSPTSL